MNSYAAMAYVLALVCILLSKRSNRVGNVIFLLHFARECFVSSQAVVQLWCKL